MCFNSKLREVNPRFLLAARWSDVLSLKFLLTNQSYSATFFVLGEQRKIFLLNFAQVAQRDAYILESVYFPQR